MGMADSPLRWMGEWTAGRESAAGRLWHLFQPRLSIWARRRLTSHLGRWVDEEDLVSLALGSFFRRLRAGSFPVVQDSNELGNVLACMVARKAIDQRRRQRRIRRLSDRPEAREGSNGAEEQGPFARSSWSPEVQALRADFLRHLLAQLTDDELRQVALLRLEGYANREIARMIGRSEATVERRLRLIRLIWDQEQSV